MYLDNLIKIWNVLQNILLKRQDTESNNKVEVFDSFYLFIEYTQVNIHFAFICGIMMSKEKI